MSCRIFVSLPWRSRSQHDFAANSCPAHNLVIWSWIWKLFHRNDHHIETMCHTQNLGCYLEGQGHSKTLQQNHVRPITLLFEVGFWNYFTEMITILKRRVMRNIWSWILKLFHRTILRWRVVRNIWVATLLLQIVLYRNDHHIETTSREQHVGRYLECQGHSMTLQQNRVRPITSLFKVLFKNYST